MKKPQTQVITLKVSDNTKEKMKEYFEDKSKLYYENYLNNKCTQKVRGIIINEMGQVKWHPIGKIVQDEPDEAGRWGEAGEDTEIEINRKMNKKRVSDAGSLRFKWFRSDSNAWPTP